MRFLHEHHYHRGVVGPANESSGNTYLEKRTNSKKLSKAGVCHKKKILHVSPRSKPE